MNNFADSLMKRIVERNSVAMVGLDPRFDLLPAELRKNCDTPDEKLAAIFAFNRAVIDIAAPRTACVKPQIAFYEVFGWKGYRLYQETVAYAKSRDMLVVGDVKRSDIGSTAAAYARGHFVSDDGAADALTVNAYLGTDGVAPFVEYASAGKGIFVLVKTSNPSSGEFQDVLIDGRTLCEKVAAKVVEWGAASVGASGYSAVGAVIGATYPSELAKFRDLMPQTPFLVPGYGAQGGTASDVAGAFDADGLGAVINSSRGVLYPYRNADDPFGEDGWRDSISRAIDMMNTEINAVRTRGRE